MAEAAPQLAWVPASSRPRTTWSRTQELERGACRFVLAPADTLKPEFASAVRRVDVEGPSVQAFAS